MTIVAAADGSALGNPGPAGWAWYVDDDHWRAGGWAHGTNNQGELMAVIDLLNATAPDADQDLRILCDSQYVINAVTKWMSGWKRKGLRKADGSPVMNLELLKQLDAALVGRRYQFEWVKGHAGHDLNEAADDRARAVATAYQSGARSIPTGPGWIHGEPESTVVDLPATGGGPQGGLHDDLNDGLDDDPDEYLSTGPVVTELDLFSELDFDEPVTVSDEQLVEQLERRLLEPALRSDPAEFSTLLHPEFEEIGASGTLWDRESIVEALSSDLPGELDYSTLNTTRLGPDAILLVYRLSSPDRSSLRSSVWSRTDGRWRIRFHQGTFES
jgi:ribonuclease HI